MAKKRILIVDDLAIYREPISIALVKEGYKTITASSGSEALKAVEASVQPFDLMIVDFSMPEMDGLAFIEKACSYKHMLGTPSLMLTDMADKEIVVNAMRLGVKEYILKSAFSLPDLLGKVRKYIEKAA